MGTSFALAVQIITGQSGFLTERPTRAAARTSVALFPVVGVLVGILLAAVWALANRSWHGQPVTVGALVFMAGALATRGQPLGGLARAADGLAAQAEGGDRNRAFAVMRDPRRGTAGLVALVVLAALKLGFLSALPDAQGGQTLILAAVLGRWATAFSYAAFPLASASGVDAETHQGLSDAGPTELVLATVVVIACGALLPVRGALTALIVGLFVGVIGQTINQRLGGLNAPLCQALGEVGEVTALACLTLH
jgi:adenosylcobinamide-GDP ribazoletransferase